MTFAVCTSWASTEDAAACPQGFPADMLEGEDTALAESLLLGCSTLLNRLAGGQYPGVCEDTVRPCGGWQGQMVAYSDGGGARPIGACTCSMARWHDSGCGCVHRGIHLPLFPVTGLTSVWLDGVELAPELFALVDRQWLVRRGDLSWPCWQDLSRPLSEARTFGITYAYGQVPDQFGVNAAVALAAQFALACTGSDECKLPERVTTLVREGETITLLDPFDLLDKGRTGIYAVDFWLRTVNPHGLDRDATVINVDLLGPHRTLHPSA